MEPAATSSAIVPLPFNLIVQLVEQLPLSYQKQLLETLTRKVEVPLAQEPSTKLPLAFGAGKGFISYVAPDFDAPLDDFNDYMP
jgi:hypothetical protein